MRVAGIVASLVLIGLGLAALFWVIPNQTVPVDPGELPGSLLPTAAAWLVVGASVWQLLQSLLASNRGQRARSPQATGAGESYRGPVFFVGSGLALSLILYLIAQFGYLIGGSIGVLLVGLLLRPTGAMRWWLVLVAAVVPAGIYYLAWQLLRLSLP